MSAPAAFLGASELRADQISLTVADELAYAALDEDVKRLVRRIAGGGGMRLLLGTETLSEDALSAAYRQGWEDAIEDVRYSRGTPSDSDIESGLRRLQSRGFR